MKTNAILLAAGMLLAVLSNTAIAQGVSILQFTSANYTVREDGGSVTLTVERIGEPDGYAYVEYATRNGTAVSGEDYVGQSGYLEFVVETNVTIVIPILNDDLTEQDETFTVTLFNPDPFYDELGDITEATVTILDNDRIRFTAPSFVVHENDGEALVTISRGEATNTALTVNYYTRNYTAMANEDYLGVPWAALTFEAGERTRTISISLVDDSVPEDDKTFLVDVWNTFFADECVVTILDDDPGVQFSAHSYSVDEGAGIAVISVRRTSAATNAFSIDYSTSDACGATAGLDYLPQSGTLNFAANETEKTFLVPILSNPLADGDKRVKLTLSNPAGVALGVPSNAELVIPDNNDGFGQGMTPQRVGIWPAIPSGASVIAVEGHYAYLGRETFRVVDISDPANPRLVGESSEVSGISGVVVCSNYAYVVSTSSGALDVIDLSDPRNPTRVGGYSTSNGIYAVAVSGNYAYAAAGALGLEVLDINNPMDLHRVGGYAGSSGPRTANGLTVSSNLVYLAYGFSGQLDVIDVSDPAHPRGIGSLDNLIETYDPPRVGVSGQYAYWMSGGLQVVDIADPSHPQVMVKTNYLWDGLASDVALLGGLAYVAVRDWYGGYGLVVLDLAHPLAPQRIGRTPTGASYGVAVSGNHAYVTGGFGMDVLDISAPTNVTRIGGLAAISSPNEIAVSGDYVYVADWGAGLVILDVADPANPRLAGRAGSGAVGLSIRCDQAFVEGGGLGVFDVTQPSNPHLVGKFNGGCSRYTSMAMEGNHVFLTVLADGYCNGGGIEVIDIRDPSSPALVRHSYVGWQNADTVVSGHFAYVSAYSPQLQVVDISDPLNPTWVNDYPFTFEYPDPDLAMSGNKLFVRFDDNLVVMDISNPANPQPIGSIATVGPSPSFLEHAGMAVAGNHVYLGGETGLQVIDVSDPANPREAAFYQTADAVWAVAVRGDLAFLGERTGLEIVDLNPLGLRPGSFTRLPSGQARFTLNTRPGHSYTVQASTNLVNWEPLETGTALGRELIFTDTNAPSFSHRFYRAVSP